MRKPIYFLCLLLIVVLITGCSRINNIIKIEEERIGVEYTGFNEIEDGVDVDSNGTRGEVKNYESNLNENIWTTQFDYMNGTDVQAFTIENDDILKINSNVDSGDVWIKITQGDLSLSDIQKAKAENNKEITVELSQWEKGEINVWLVVENGENGLIQIEHIEN
ncbi:MAG: hypothetical protein GX072_03870 [Lysinibacillus sp.]|nr:hypothetical protein [Lysinibacillus sp.]